MDAVVRLGSPPAHVRINPERARHFARARGKRAKTDAIDARMLAELGPGERGRLATRPEPAVDPDRLRLAGLSRRRDQLVAIRKQERTRRSEQDDPLLAASLDRHLAWLDRDIAELDRAIREAVQGSPALSHDAALLRSAPGIGPVAATVLIAQLPELGRISHKAIAALAGLAPFNNDSGAFRGKRSTGPPSPPPAPTPRSQPSTSDCAAPAKTRPHRPRQKTPHNPQRHPQTANTLQTNFMTTQLPAFAGEAQGRSALAG